MDICGKINRYNYASTENHERYREFCNKLNNIKQEFELDTELNANCDLILGLDFRLRNLYDQSLIKLQKAIDRAKIFATEGADILLYPGKSTDEIKAWNKKLANICLYHCAIIQYNLGEYKIAVNMFESALAYDERDIKAMLYIPEAKFLGADKVKEEFDSIVQDIERIASVIEKAVDIAKWTEPKNSLLSQLYIRYGNCYFAKSAYEPYAQFRSLQKALDKYKKAYDYAPESYITKFSYAQALSARAKQKGTSEISDRDESQELFRKAFSQVKGKIAETTEAKILMMLYYILAICCKDANIEGENPRMYVLGIYREVPNLPSKEKLRIFSPRTKNDLVCNEFLKELQEFENTL